MKKEEYPCPCGGKVKWTKKKVEFEGVNCGILDVEICKKCKTEYLPDESMQIVEQKLKEKGLWGMERQKVSFWKSGTSVVMRIPKKIADALGIKISTKAHIYPEGEHKLIVEL